MRYLILILLTGCAHADRGHPDRLRLDEERACRAAYTATSGDYHGAFMACERLR